MTTKHELNSIDSSSVNIQKIFGKNVRYYRLLRNMTQAKLANKIDRSEETISNIERGVSVAKIEILLDLAKALEVSIDALFVTDRDTNSDKKENVVLIRQILDLLNKQNDKMLEIILEHVKNLDKYNSN